MGKQEGHFVAGAGGIPAGASYGFDGCYWQLETVRAG